MLIIIIINHGKILEHHHSLIIIDHCSFMIFHEVSVELPSGNLRVYVKALLHRQII